MKNKGFTLMELLAVIVILAIIALIATPIILGIIKETKEETTIASAQNYLDAVGFSMTNALLNTSKIEDGKYTIMEDGNICIGILTDNVCEGDILKIEVDGEVPKVGSIITIKDGQISEINLKYKNKTIIKDQNGKLIYSKSQNEYQLGQEIVFNPGDGDRTWNVIGEDYNTVTLILSENIGYSDFWYKDINDIATGPVSALNNLNDLTKDWKNVAPISSYNFINNETGSKVIDYEGQKETIPLYGYKKLMITNGQSKLINEDGTKPTNIEGVTRARLITVQEIIEISKKLNPKLNEENIKKIFRENIDKISSILNLKDILGTENINIEMVELILSSVMYNFTNEENLILLALSLNALKCDFAKELNMPKFLYQKLYEISFDNNDTYLTLNTVNLTNDAGYVVTFTGEIGSIKINSSSKLRPVITILKTKL